MKRLYKDLICQEKGLTLIEVLISIVILGIIIVAFLNHFVYSTIANKKSGDVLDATYIAQNIMEEIYGESKAGGEIPIKSIEDRDSYNGYIIDEIVEEAGESLARVIVKVYADEYERKLEAQMETYLLWNQ